MPEFLKLCVEQLREKSDRIRRDYSSISTPEFREVFERFWVPSELPESEPSKFSVLAVDSSSQHVVTSNGGIFYVVRALALSRDVEYRELVSDFDYTSDPSHSMSDVISRKMEWLEHKAALNALKANFDGVILLDGSIYGRLAHIPMETGYVNDRAFMLDYFDTVSSFLEMCRARGIPVIGISKESRTAFFREFLIKTLACEIDGISTERVEKILSLALDNKRIAIKELEKLEKETGVTELRKLVEELFARKPDFQLILSCAETAGYTKPLLLGPSIRWKRFYERMLRDPVGLIRSNFPVSSRDERDGRYGRFLDRAMKVVQKILELPSVVSFHILPALNDTPMRIDVPAWVFGIDTKLSEVGWPEPVDVNVDWILELVSAGYCGLENYNIWLSAVDRKVKLSREVFENLYLPEFEKIVGKSATSRGYRRVRFP